MIATASYRVELRIDGVLIGDIRPLARNLTWSKRRTRVGVDAISFTVNDVLLQGWLSRRNYTIGDILKPIALDCRIVRNGTPVVGGFLATMPSYSPNGTSADLNMQFDGYLNLLAGVYIAPRATESGRMGQLVQKWISEAETRSSAAGKAFGFTAGTTSTMASVDYTFDNYKAVKDAITDRCDNVSGAGPFDVVFNPDRSYDIYSDADFGDEITDYVVQYPARINGVSAASISAPEVQGFASVVIGIGEGEVSNNPAENTAIISKQVDSNAIKTYGYVETLLQESSVSRQETLNNNVATELQNRASIRWQPQITLLGTQVAPVPSGARKIWIGDYISLENSEDLTGMTTGQFRVDEITVKVSASGGEAIQPTLSSGAGLNTSSFAKEFVRMRNEILALKTA